VNASHESALARASGVSVGRTDGVDPDTSLRQRIGLQSNMGIDDPLAESVVDATGCLLGTGPLPGRLVIGRVEELA
jgi:hypothetical protein